MSTNEELEVKIDTLTSVLVDVVKMSAKRVADAEDKFNRLETAHNDLVKAHNSLKDTIIDIFSGDDGK